MAMWSRHTPKWSVKGLKKFRSKSLGELPASLLTTFNQNLHYAPILLSLWPPRAFHPLSPSVISTIWTQSHHNDSSLSPSHQYAAKKYPCPFRVSVRTKKCERKRKAVVIDEDTVRAADKNGNGDAKTAQKRGKRMKSANAKPRTKRTKVGKGRGSEGKRRPMWLVPTDRQEKKCS